MPHRPCRRRRRRDACLIGALALAVALGPALALAQPAPPARDVFKGVALLPAGGDYLVVKDANVRARPDTKSDRVASVAKGSRVEAAGRAEGGWIAIRQGGVDLGFVYESMLVPLIDGALAKDIEGAVTALGGVFCRYVVHFEGKSPTEEQGLEIADYTVSFRCDDRGRKFAFRSYMFITEAPYQMSEAEVYQINIDVRDVGDSFEEVFSTTLLYQRADAKVVYEGTNLPEFEAKPKDGAKAAKSVAEALAGAVEMTARAWNAKVWQALAKVGG